MVMTEEQALQNINMLIAAIRQLGMTVDASLDDGKFTWQEQLSIYPQAAMLAQQIYTSFVAPDSQSRKVYLNVLSKGRWHMDQG